MLTLAASAERARTAPSEVEARLSRLEALRSAMHAARDAWLDQKEPSADAPAAEWDAYTARKDRLVEMYFQSRSAFEYAPEWRRVK